MPEDISGILYHCTEPNFNTIMNSFCEFISKIAPNDAASVQAWAALATAGIAGYALFSWKNQRHYDVYLNCLGQYNEYAFLISTYIYRIIGYLRDNIDSDDLDVFTNFLMKNLDDSRELLKKVQTIELIKQIRNQNKDCILLYDLYYFLNNSYMLANDYCIQFLKEQDFSIRKKEELITRLKTIEKANQMKIEDFRNIQNPKAN